MNCLCCGKPLEENASSAWHKRCIRKFFGTDELPEMQLADEALENYALQTVYKGMTVPGVQRKMSMHLSKEEKPRLTLVNYPAGYILYTETADFGLSLPSGSRGPGDAPGGKGRRQNSAACAS